MKGIQRIKISNCIKLLDEYLASTTRELITKQSIPDKNKTDLLVITTTNEGLNGEVALPLHRINTVKQSISSYGLLTPQRLVNHANRINYNIEEWIGSLDYIGSDDTSEYSTERKNQSYIPYLNQKFSRIAPPVLEIITGVLTVKVSVLWMDLDSLEDPLFTVQFGNLHRSSEVFTVSNDDDNQAPF